MFRIRSLSSLALVLAGTVVLSACGGGGRHASAVPPTSAANAPIPPGAIGVTTATFAFTFPKSMSSANKRRAQYVSQAMQSLTFQVTKSLLHGTATDITTAETAVVPGAFALQSQNFSDGNPPSGNGSLAGHCGVDSSNAGNYKCTATFQVPIGDVNVTLITRDAQQTGGCTGTCGNILSENKATGLWVKQGVANAYSLSLDANAAAMAVTASSGFCAGSFTVANSGSVATVGTTPVTFNASYTDPATKTIVSPGLPLLTVNGHTDDNPAGGHIGYTDSTTHLNVKVSQSPPSFTLTQTAGTGSAAVAVTATPPSAGDGLSFNQTLNFTFTSGSAVPSSFLADAEQILDGNAATTGGVVHLWSIGGGGSSFTAASPSSLSAQPPPGPANSDVDFPNDLVFDGNGDLLIANGGTGSPDFGNFSCVPAGSITTPANNATILTNNLDDPTHIAFSAPNPSVINGDSSVALSNSALPASGGYSDVEFVLSGTYAAASTSRDVARVGNAVGIGVVALAASATNPAGSYAVSTYEGSSKTSKVEIIRPDGSTSTLSDADIAHATLAYDSKHKQLIVVSDGRSKNGCSTLCYQQSNIQVWNVDPVSKAYELKPLMTSDGSDTFPLGPVDVSSDGVTAYVAVAVSNDVSNPELNVYTNSGAALTQVGSSLDYGASDCASAGSGSANYFYGGSSLNQNTVTTLKFLGSLNRLLVGLESEQGAPPSLSRTGANGMYIYDVTQTSSTQTGTRGCDGDTGVTLGASTVVQSAFQVLSNRPLAAAYKP